jgi:anti-anti-sigma regulatory factor
MLRITRRDGRDGDTVLELAGRVTEAELPALEEALRACGGPGAAIALDLAGVSYADAAGAEALVALARRRVGLVAPRGFVRRLLEEVAR